MSGIPGNSGFWTAVMVFVGILTLPIEAAEYLEADTPIPKSLSQSPSATQGIAAAPEAMEQSEKESPPIIQGLVRDFHKEFLSNTGIQGIDDTVFTLRPRVYYRYRNNNGEQVDDVAAIGGALSMQSGWFADAFRVTLVGYTSQSLYRAPGSGGGGLLRPDGQGITVLGQAFAEVKAWDSTLFFGRIPMDTPYINGNDTRMIPNTFEGVGFTSNVIKNLRFGVAHFFSIKPRDGVDFVSMSEQAGAVGTTDGVSAFGFRYTFTDLWKLGAVNQYGWNTLNTAYVEFEGSVPLSEDWNMVLKGQFTDQRSVGEEWVGSFTTQSAGAQLAFGYKSLIASANFTWTDQGAGIRKPWGGSPSFNSTMISDFDRAGEISFRAGLSMDFSDLGLTGLAASANLLFGDTPDSGAAASPDQQEVNVTVDYRPDLKYFDNVWLRFRYAENQMSNGFDRRELRLTLNYSVSF